MNSALLNWNLCWWSSQKWSSVYIYSLIFKIIIEPPHGKTNKMTCAPSKDSRSAYASTQSDQSPLSAWRNHGSLAAHNVHSLDSDQTESLLGAHVILMVLSFDSSIIKATIIEMSTVHKHLPDNRMCCWTCLNFDLVAQVAECLRTLIFSTLNRSSSHRCGFEPSLGHM